MPAPLAPKAEFYVIGVDEVPPWVLTNERPMTIAECEAAIRWQGSGGNEASRWAIAYWDPYSRMFIENAPDGRTFEVQRGPYTVAAFESFMASLPPAP